MTSDQPKPSIWGKALIGRDNVPELQQLLDLGADIHEIEEPESKYSLLHCAAENGAIENVQFLLKNGANPIAKDVRGKTPSALAYDQGNLKMGALIDKYAEKHRKSE